MEILFVGTVRPRAQFARFGLFAGSGLFAADPLPVAPAPDGPTIANSNATVAASVSSIASHWGRIRLLTFMTVLPFGHLGARQHRHPRQRPTASSVRPLPHVRAAEPDLRYARSRGRSPLTGQV